MRATTKPKPNVLKRYPGAIRFPFEMSLGTLTVQVQDYLAKHRGQFFYLEALTAADVVCVNGELYLVCSGFGQCQFWLHCKREQARDLINNPLGAYAAISYFVVFTAEDAIKPQLALKSVIVDNGGFGEENHVAFDDGLPLIVIRGKLQELVQRSAAATSPSR